MENHDPIVVIKVGGSLLSLPDLPGRLHAILRDFRDMRLLIVCGGGEAADVVRRWQDVHRLTDEQAHWLAFRAVSLNEALLSHVLRDAVVVPSRNEMQTAWRSERLPILAVEPFTRTEESHSLQRLPHDWNVTSDSIAAWIAKQLGGNHVVLCKSCELVPDTTLGEAAARSMVDAHFPLGAAGLAIDWVNLRADAPRLIRWQRAPESHRAGFAGIV